MQESESSTATIRQLLHQAAAQSGQPSRLELEMLLAHVLERERTWLYAHAEVCPHVDQVRHFHALLQARRDGRPMAYLTGQREFWSMQLAVTADTLIPRADTETLVHAALRRLPGAGETIRVADLGTGSGAVALALARERADALVLGVDSSRAALDVARANAASLGCANVAWSCSDWCTALARHAFDMLVANPPYIAADDPHLSQGDVRFEPATALIAGADGLDAIRTLISQAPGCLHSGGWLLFEHGHDQGAQVRALLAAGGLASVFTELDLAGRERVSGGRWET